MQMRSKNIVLLMYKCIQSVLYNSVSQTFFLVWDLNKITNTESPRTFSKNLEIIFIFV